MLTIAIPSYNRNEKLVRSVESLAPQLNAQVKILILDNCSPTPVAESLGKLLQENIKIIRNPCNVGVSANIIRCFEHCDTEWMWLLGDDDPPLADAVATILQAIGTHADFGFLNFKSALCEGRIVDTLVTGPNEFISSIDNFGNILFISSGVYNLRQLKADLRLTYQLSYCLAPHLVYLLSGIKAETRVGFLNKELVNLWLHDTAVGESWSWLSISMSIPVLYEVPLAIGAREKQLLAQHIRTHIKPPAQIFAILEQPRYQALPIYEKRFMLRQVFFRSLLFRFRTGYIVSFLWSDLKLFFRDKFQKRKVAVIMPRDERL